MQLLVSEPCYRRSDSGLSLEISDFEYLALGFRLSASCEVFSDSFPVEPPGDPEDALTGRIRELRDDERTEWIHARFATSTGKSAFGMRRAVGYQLLGWRPHGDSNPGSHRERVVSWARLDDG